MADHVYKTVEVTGSSPVDIGTAINVAVTRAAATLRNLDWFEVISIRGHIDGAEVAHFQVTLKLGFRLLDPDGNG